MKNFNKNKISISRSFPSTESTRIHKIRDIRDVPTNPHMTVSPFASSSFYESGQTNRSNLSNKSNYGKDYEDLSFPKYDQKHNKKSLAQEMERRMMKEMSDRGLNTWFTDQIKQTDEQILFSSVLGKEPKEAVDFLSTTKIDTNIKDYWGNNVLIVLCLKSEIDTLLNILTDCLENFSENTLYDFLIYLVSTTYQSISIEQQSDILKVLLESTGEEILNKIDEFGNTIIMHSLENYYMLELLLENKSIDLSITNLCGNNPISYCVESGLEESLNLLITYAKSNYSKEKQKEILNQKNFTMQTPLMLAVESKSVDMVKTLLKTKLIDVNCKNYEGKTPLLYSIEKELTEITEILLNVKDIDINIVDNYKNNTITKAIESGNHKLTLSLLSKMVNLDITDSVGRSPLLHLLELKYSGLKIMSGVPNIAPFDFSFVGTSCFGEYDGSSGLGGYAPYQSTSKSKFDIFSKQNKMFVGINDESGLYNVIASKLINSDHTDVNVSDIQGLTPMTLICNNEDIFLFDILMADKKYNIHKKNIKGVSDYQYIKTKYETMACSLFGSEKYCPIKTCPIHKKFNNIKTEVEIIKDTAKEIEFKLSSSESTKHNNDFVFVDDVDITNPISEDFSDFEMDTTHKIKEIDIPFGDDDNCYIPNQQKYDQTFKTRSMYSTESFSNFYVPDIGPNNLYDGVGHTRQNKILEPVRKVSEIEIKKFSVLKYFYEQMEKTNTQNTIV